MAVNSLLHIGANALTAHQVAINVTGNNIANVDTIGYSRQSVRYEAFQPVSGRVGEIGMGAYVAEVYRNYDAFAERAFLTRYNEYSRWEEQQNILATVESLFNESNKVGINSYLNMFFQDWEDLTTRPEDAATREALLADALNMVRLMQDNYTSMEDLQREMDLLIQQAVNDVNEILVALQEINKQIMQSKTAHNNPNSLYDKRDQLIRELSQYLDIEVQERVDGYLTIQTSWGLPLLDGESIFSLEVRNGAVESALSTYSTYTGTVEYTGTDGYEYTLEIVNAGDLSAVPPIPPEFRVSLDGGKTWLQNEDGTEMHFAVEGASDPSDLSSPTLSIKVKDLEITFTSSENFCVGDTFTIVPKTTVCWVSPTRGAINITPQVYSDGSENNQRITGGTLAAYFVVRDYQLTDYMDQMDALAKALIWELNLLHSQGAGTTLLSGATGTYSVNNTTAALGLSSTGLAFYDKLSTGNLSFALYDDDGNYIETQYLDFSFVNPPGVSYFDPSVHSLDDVATAINNMVFTDANGNTYSMNATIINGSLVVDSGTGANFAIDTDTAGLMAGLGINTFFTGSGAKDIGINAAIVQDPSLIASASVNADGSVAEGDNSTALAIAELATRAVTISTTRKTTEASLLTYHATVVSIVGSASRTAQFNANYYGTLASELDERCSSVSGVNLDEEMTNLIKFQHSYTAAAKLITTADQMLQTLLSLKQ